jgi:hypothetical protein
MHLAIAECWFLRPWRWKRRVSLKHHLTLCWLHGVICQMTIGVRTSNPTHFLSSPISNLTKTHSVALLLVHAGWHTDRRRHDKTKGHFSSDQLIGRSEKRISIFENQPRNRHRFSPRTIVVLSYCRTFCKFPALEDYSLLMFSWGCVHVTTFVPHLNVQCLLSPRANVSKSFVTLGPNSPSVVSRILKLCAAETNSLRATGCGGPYGWDVEAPLIDFRTVLTDGGEVPYTEDFRILHGSLGPPFRCTITFEKFFTRSLLSPS